MAEQPKIRDFICDYSNSVGVSAEVTQDLDLEFPDAYKHRETMVKLSLAIKEYNHDGFALLPFCRTVEMEAVGGNVNFGDANTGPRSAAPICESPEDFLALPDIDFSQGRIREVLEACRMLAEAGEHVCLEIVGPWTQMQSLMESRKVIKMQRKQPEATIAVMNKIGEQLLHYVDEARACGVEIITYSDSAGSLEILSPKLMEWSTREFTHPFMKKLVRHIDDTMVLQLCPKFAYALIDTGLADVKIHDMGEKVDFFEAILQLRGQLKIVGQACIKNSGVSIANGKIRELVLA